MGRFEDIIEQARSGDVEEAMSAMESEFSGSTLREKAERADSMEKELQEAKPFMRQARFNELTAKLDEGLREVLTVQDVGDMEPSQLTLEHLQDLGTTKVEKTQATRLESAKDAGFDSIEDYESALETVKQQKAKRTADMEGVSKGVASSSGEPGQPAEPTRFEKGQEAFKGAKEDGATDDIAQAHFIDAILTDQTEGEET